MFRRDQDRGSEFASDERIQHLVERDTPVLDVPDHIYGLGGAGTRMVLEIFHQDWFVVEALKGRNRPVQVHLIDTATEGEDNVEEEIQTLDERTSQLEQRYRSNNPEETVGTVSFSQYNINTNLTVRSWDDLVGERTVETILDEPRLGVDEWWLKKRHLRSPNDPSNLFQISNGVIKRRALSKALHYKCRVSDDRNYRDEFQTNNDEDRIAIFSSLGGGTGSGLCIDVAREIYTQNEAAQIHLFATLPAPEEQEVSLKNTYAALGELEYLHLSERENPFNQLFLFSLEPTEHDTEATSSADVLEFDATLPYVLTSVYNRTDADLALSETKSYAPFTMVVPQVLHYRRDEVKRAKDATEELFQAKREALNKEYLVIEEVETYIDENYDVRTLNTDVSETRREVRDYVQVRIERLVKLLDSDIIEQLNIDVERREEIFDKIYGDGFERGVDDLEQVLQRRSTDSIVDDLMQVYRKARSNGDSSIDKYTALTGQFVTDIVFHEIKRIDRLRRLLTRVVEVDEQERTDLHRRILNYLCVPTISARGRIEDLGEEVNDKQEAIVQTEERLAERREELEEAEERDRRDVQAAYEEWYEQVRDDIESYTALRDLDLRSKLNGLRRDLQTLVNNLDGDARAETQDVQERLDSIEASVRNASGTDGIEESELEQALDEWKSEITSSVEQLLRARDAWQDLEAELESGGLLPDIFGSDEIDTRAYEQKSARVGSLFSLPPAGTESAVEGTQFPRSVDLRYDIESDPLGAAVEERRTTLRQRIVGAFREQWTRLAPETETGGPDLNLGQLLMDTPSDRMESQFESEIKESFRVAVGSELPTLEADVADLEAELDRLNEEHSHLTALEDLYYEVVDERDDVSDQLDDFVQGLETGSEMLSGETRVGVSLDDSDRFRHTVGLGSQRTVMEAIDEPSLRELQSTLSADSTAPDVGVDLKDYLTRLVMGNGIDTKYCGVDTQLLTKSGVGAYPDGGAWAGFVGEVFDTSLGLGGSTLSEIVEGPLVDNFLSEESQTNHDRWTVPSSHPWEAGFVLFYQGMTVLDNLRPVVSGRRGYAKQYDDDRSPDERLTRHSLGLRHGEIVHREERVDPTTPDLFFEPDAEVQEAILEKHRREEVDTTTLGDES